jgi:hypothetical protein
MISMQTLFVWSPIFSCMNFSIFSTYTTPMKKIIRRSWMYNYMRFLLSAAHPEGRTGRDLQKTYSRERKKGCASSSALEKKSRGPLGHRLLMIVAPCAKNDDIVNVYCNDQTFKTSMLKIHVRHAHTAFWWKILWNLECWTYLFRVLKQNCQRGSPDSHLCVAMCVR